MTSPPVSSAGSVTPEGARGIVPQTAREKAEGQVRQMEQARARKVQRWRDIQAYIAPFSANVDPQSRAYDEDAVDVLDESIFYARNTLASFLYSGMTNPARPWRQWVLPDPDLAESQAAKAWTWTLNERAAIVLAHSNFYEVMSGVYDEWPSFGTSVVLVEEDDEDVLRYVHLNVGSYALADDHRGRCVAISRRFLMTVDQLVSRFAPKDAMGEPVLTDLSMFSEQTRKHIRDGRWQAEVEVAHLIRKNPKARAGAVRPRDFAWSSDYWEWRSPREEGRDGFLAREGYREWPAMVFRWGRLAGDAYGTNYPGVQSLAAVKSAQAMEADLLMQVETQAKPPLVVPNELAGASLLPAARNAVDTRAGMQVGPLHRTEPMAIRNTADVQNIVRERIFSLWWTRLVLALTGQQSGDKTAREIEEISTEKLTVLGRVVEAAQSAFQQGSDREFAILSRRGMLPPAPEELQGRTLSIEYTSALAVAMRSLGLQNLVNYGLTMANVARETGDPSVLRRTDWSQWAQEVGQRSGIPPMVQRSDEQVAALDAADREAASKMQEAEMAAKEAQAAKALGTTPMAQGGSALDALVQGAGQGVL